MNQGEEDTVSLFTGIMELIVKLLIVLQTGYFCHGDNTHSMSKGPTDEQRLLAAILHEYDKHTRPVMNASTSVTVKLGITLNQIFDVDERNQVLTSHIWLDQEWYDEKLQWSPEEFNNLTVLRMPCQLLWRPDIVIYNSADDYTTTYMPALAMLSNNGRVFWPPIVKMRSTCKIDITYFPFDDQTCSLKFGSWAYDGLQVDVLKRDHPIDLSNYVSNGEWELIDVKVTRNVQYYNCCPEPYPDVTFTLHIRRRTLYYTYNVIIPCIMLSSLTLLGFWMPPEGGEKVGLGLTVLLAFSVFMLLIAENMPATSFYIPLIGVYIIVAMGLTCISVTCSVIVSYLHHQSIMGREVPVYLQKLGYVLNNIVKVRSRMRHPGKPPSLDKKKLKETNKTNRHSQDTQTENCFNTMNFTFRTEMDNFDFENIYFGSNGGMPSDDAMRSQKSSSGNKNSVLYDELMKRLDILLSRHEKILCSALDVKPHVNKEWQEIAEVIDRSLFWVYSFILILCTVVILLFVPLGKTVSI